MSVVEKIVELCRPLMQNYQSDLLHDKEWVENNPGAAFVHITRANGTHLFEMPSAEALVDDRPIPFLFGQQRPSVIYKQYLDVMRGPLKESSVQWLYCDGRRVSKSSADVCIVKFERALGSAKAKAERQRGRLQFAVPA
jgi:hypothetical protein